MEEVGLGDDVVAAKGDRADSGYGIFDDNEGTIDELISKKKLGGER